ncbi:MAG TPA: hypothetical protein VGE50_11460 [Gammaproteobacteria bacterium]
MDKPHIAQCVELLCEQGCSEVRSTIARLEANQTVAQVSGFSAQERSQVLDELKSIMAVYDRPPQR